MTSIISIFCGVISMMFIAASSTLGAEIAGGGMDGKLVLPRLIAGLEPELLEPHKLKIFRGFTADTKGTTIAVYPADVIVDLNQIGFNGMDSAPPVPGGDYFIYAIKKVGDKGAGFVVSREISYSKVNTPPGYALVRKLPWGFKYFSDGVRPYHLSYWPKPFTRYTFSATSPEWAVLERGQANGLTAVSLDKFVPDNARLAYVICVLQSARGSTAYLSSGGRQELMLGQSSNGIASVTVIHQRITSRKELFYRVTGDGFLSIYVLGYSQTEPS